MRKRPNAVLKVVRKTVVTSQRRSCVRGVTSAEERAYVAVPLCLLCCALAILPGCSNSAASDEYRDYANVEKADNKDGDLPVITPATDPEPDTAAATDVAALEQPQTTDETPVATVSQETKVPIVDENAKEATDTGLLKETGTRDEVVMAPKEIKLLIASKDFTKDKETKATRVSYDDIDLLKILNMEPVPTNAAEHFPDWLKSLSGKRIRIRGFMYPPYQSTGLTGFLLARDNGICCFVRKAKIYDLFVVKLAEGETTDYIANRPFDVVGTFHIDPLVEDDELLQLYRIDEARVIAK